MPDRNWISSALALLASAQWTNGAEIHHARKSRLLQGHLLYERVLSQADWPELYNLVVHARKLPLSATFQVACLIQGEEDVSAKEEAFWNAGSDVFKLTFQTPRPDALFFPRSLLAEGRNFLLAAAAFSEIRAGWRYSYYCFFDADTYFVDWAVGWRNFTTFLQEWEPAVGLPEVGLYSHAIDMSFENLPESDAPTKSVFNFDHIVVAVHSDASHLILPYVTDADADCQWVSQWRFSSLANALFPGHVLLTRALKVENVHHSTYSKERCVESMTNATMQLRTLAPQNARNCFVLPQETSGISVQGFPKLSAYLPWSKPLRRLQAELANWNYSNAAIATIKSCHQEPVVLAMESEHEFSWCHGCEFPTALAVLQSIIANKPFDFPNSWIRLANLLGTAAADTNALIVADMTLCIGMRLLRCHGFDASLIAWKDLQDFSRAHERLGIPLHPNSATLRQMEQRMLSQGKRIMVAARAALLPYGEGANGMSYISPENLKSLVSILLGCPGPVDA